MHIITYHLPPSNSLNLSRFAYIHRPGNRYALVVEAHCGGVPFQRSIKLRIDAGRLWSHIERADGKAWVLRGIGQQHILIWNLHGPTYSLCAFGPRALSVSVLSTGQSPVYFNNIKDSRVILSLPYTNIIKHYSHGAPHIQANPKITLHFDPYNYYNHWLRRKVEVCEYGIYQHLIR